MLDHAADTPSGIEERAAMHLAGGVSNHGYQCGILWGGALYAGARAYRQHGSGRPAETKAIMATQRVLELFRSLTKNKTNCRDMTGLDLTGKIRLTRESLKFLVRGGPVYCVRVLVKYARAIYDDMPTAFPEIQGDTARPVSCASRLAQKAGASDQHAVTAAGLAGGIGLSGGGCGALGAAIWIYAMNHRKDPGINRLPYAGIDAMIDELSRKTGGKLECGAIVGRRFENVSDHAEFLRDGGCDEIIEALAAGAKR